MSFLGKGEVGERDVKFTLVTDFSQPEKLIDATIAFYVKSPEIKSPMASQVAAFETDDAYKQYKKDLNGIYLTWGELTTQFKWQFGALFCRHTKWRTTYDIAYK